MDNEMNEINQLSNIKRMPIKFIAALIIMLVFNAFSAGFDAVGFVLMLFVMYTFAGAVNYIAKLSGNWIIGIIGTFAVLFVFMFILDKFNFPRLVQNILLALISLSGVILDVYRIVKYVSAKKK